jgi:hypothetical protein
MIFNTVVTAAPAKSCSRAMAWERNDCGLAERSRANLRGRLARNRIHEPPELGGNIRPLEMPTDRIMARKQREATDLISRIVRLRPARSIFMPTCQFEKAPSVFTLREARLRGGWCYRKLPCYSLVEPY